MIEERIVIHTVTLEDQGIPADIANHRRSVNASQTCQVLASVERYDPRRGQRRPKLVRCLNDAVSLGSDGVNRCQLHRDELA